MQTISPILNIMIKASEKASKALIRDFGEVENLQVSVKGPSNFVSNAPAKVIKSFLTKTKLDTPALKAGYIEESIYLGHDKLDILVSLKSKEELLGDLILLLQSPMKNLISSLGSAKQNITGILKSLENNPITCIGNMYSSIKS